MQSDASPILVEKVSDTKNSANDAMISMVDINRGAAD